MRMYQPGPHGQAPAVTWRQWLLPLGAAAGIVALLALSPRMPSGIRLSYSQFLNDVGAGSVRAVTINPAGQVAGSLVTGKPFATTIPVALGDRTLAGQLAVHHVQITATAAMPSSPLPELIGLLLLVMIGGLLYVGVRGARGEAAGLRGLTGVGELTKANTRIIDAERPATRFADVAGYAAGPVSYGEAHTWSFFGPAAPRGYSERTQWLIDREVATLLTRAEARARELLTEHLEALHQLTTALVERETVPGDQVRAILRAASPPSASADRPDLH